MRPRAVEFILFHSKSDLANRAASEICLVPVPCTGFASRSYVGSVVPGILSPFITAQQFNYLGDKISVGVARASCIGQSVPCDG